MSPAKKADVEQKTTPDKGNALVPPVEPEGSDRQLMSINDEKFFDRLSEMLAQRQPDGNVLLNIPIWGWTGDGKTCSLLTAVHFCDPSLHPLGFSLVSNTDELVALEGSTEAYKGLNLAGTAAATTERLRQLSESFIDKNEWPPGTDEPSAYILAVRDIASTLGYVLFPDIKGGSFRELDETAREVLRKAHAAILLVNPELYAKQTTDGRRYRDEILVRLQKFAEAQVPVCVMITKADLHQGANQFTDTTHKLLTVVVERQKALQGLLCRVSVIGLDKELFDNKLPSVAERNPEHLIKAWIWVVSQALCRPAQQLRDILPSVNIRSVAGRPVSLQLETLPELRQVGDFSGSPGLALCASSDDSRIPSFTFISDTGELLEASFDLSSKEEPKFRTVGTIPEWATATEVESFYLGGEYFVGSKDKCNFIWQGAKGGPLARIPLPFEMASWVPASSRRLLGVDSSGRLHSFRQESGKWVQVDFLEGFIAPSAFMICAYLEGSSHALVYNGTSVDGVTILPDGKFGERVAPALSCKYDSPQIITNRLGLCLAINKSDHASLSATGKAVDLGPVKTDATSPVALAPLAPLVAVTGPDLRLTVALVSSGEVRKSGQKHSPVLHDDPRSMVWTRNGELLVATFDDGTWGIFRPLGLTG